MQATQDIIVNVQDVVSPSHPGPGSDLAAAGGPGVPDTGLTQFLHDVSDNAAVWLTSQHQVWQKAIPTWAIILATLLIVGLVVLALVLVRRQLRQHRLRQTTRYGDFSAVQANEARQAYLVQKHRSEPQTEIIDINQLMRQHRAQRIVLHVLPVVLIPALALGALYSLLPKGFAGTGSITTWIQVASDNTGAVNLMFNATDTFTVTGLNGGSDTVYNGTTQPVATTGLRLATGTGSYNLVIDGNNQSPATPLEINLQGVTLNSTNAPIALNNTAAVNLTIDGSNSLTAIGNNAAGIQLLSGNRLTVTSTSGGQITARGHSNGSTTGAAGAAGIGGYGKNMGTAGTVLISGNVNLTALGARDGAGIGGGAGSNGRGGTVTVTDDAVVVATGGYDSAGIGGGYYSSGGTTNISGSAKVKAQGGGYSAGIGGGTTAAGGTTNISGRAKVLATGGGDGAGIGGGTQYGGFNYNDTGTVNISGEPTVAALGGAALTGAGGIHLGGDITVTGGSVFAGSGASGVPVGKIKNANGTALSPLYVGTALTNPYLSLRRKTVAIPIGGASPYTYTAYTTTAEDVDYFGTKFPMATLSAVLWVPVKVYDNITIDGVLTTNTYPEAVNIDVRNDMAAYNAAQYVTDRTHNWLPNTYVPPRPDYAELEIESEVDELGNHVARFNAVTVDSSAPTTVSTNLVVDTNLAYDLYISMIGADGQLVNSADPSYAIPGFGPAAFGGSTWAYSADHGSTWHTVPVASQPISLPLASTLSDGRYVHELLFGVTLNHAQLSGEYRGQVLYQLVPRH